MIITDTPESAFDKVGPPLTDRGTNFTSLLLKHLSRYLRVTQYRTTAFHPQSNGSLERSHAVLADYLKQYVDSRHEWDEFRIIPASTKAPVSLRTNWCSEKSPANHPANHITRTIARDNLVESKLKSKKYYDRKINPQIFQPNDPVFLLKEPKRGKLSDNYTGPYRIYEVLENNNVKIFVNGKARTVHTNKLKLAHIPANNK
ncbi:Retrovirus-related Pol polyprotein from transposon 412 [Anthophora retusa]